MSESTVLSPHLPAAQPLWRPFFASACTCWASLLLAGWLSQSVAPSRPARTWRRDDVTTCTERRFPKTSWSRFKQQEMWIKLPTNIYAIYRYHISTWDGLLSAQRQANYGSKAGRFTCSIPLERPVLKKNSYLWPKDFLLMVANSAFWNPEPPCSNVCKLPTCLCILYPWGWWSKTELRLQQETAEVYPQGQPSLPFILCFQSCYLNLIGILFLPIETLNNVIRSLIFSYLFHVSPVALSNKRECFPNSWPFKNREHDFLKLIWCWSFPTFSDLPSSKLT